MRDVLDYLKEHEEDELVVIGLPQSLKGKEVLRQIQELDEDIIGSAQYGDKLLIQMSTIQVKAELL